MFSSSGNRLQRFFRVILDILNILLGVAVVAAAVFTFLNVQERAWVFPIIFAMGAGMNLFTGIKYLMTERTRGGIVMLVAAAVLGGIAFVTYYSVGGIFR